MAEVMLGTIGTASRIFASLATTALLSACYESRDTIVIDADGHATMASTYIVDTSADGAPIEDPFCEFEDPGYPGVAVSWEKIEDGPIRTCTVTTSGTLDDIVAVGEQEIAGLDESTLEVLDSVGSGGFEKDGDVWIYTSRTELGSQFMSDPAIPPEVIARAASSLEGRTAEFSFTAPRIISSNGQISADRTTTTFVAPLVDEAGDIIETIEFEVRFSLE